MHSGGLHERPLNFLAKLLPSDRIIFHERSSYGLSISDTTEAFYNKRQTQDLFNKESSKFQLPELNAGVLIGYDKSWNYFKHQYSKNAKKVVFDDSRNGGAWVDFIQEKSSNYIDEELNNNFPHHKNKNTIIIFIGRLHLDISGNYIKSFIKIIDEISKTVGNKYPVFIKTHIFSDIEFTKRLILQGIGENKMDYILTKLHPSVLASRAAISFFIGPGTVINEISNLKIPIVQCLHGFDESTILNMMWNKTDYFLTEKTNNFSDILNKAMSVDNSPIIYKKNLKDFDCSFL